MKQTSFIPAAVRRPASHIHGIFCLEVDWWSNLESHKSFTVRPILELVSQMHAKLKFIHRTIATRYELEHYLARWVQKQYADYPILYLAMHGTPGWLYLGESSRAQAISLIELSNLLEGRCKNRVVHLASCQSLQLHKSTLNAFLRRTGAHAISGYTSNVGMLESSALEVLMLDRMQYHKLDINGVRAIDTRLSKLVPSLRRELGFRFVTA